MTVTEILASVMTVHHLNLNMMMTLTVEVIKKKYCRHNELAVTVNDAARPLQCRDRCHTKVYGNAQRLFQGFKRLLTLVLNAVS